MYRDEAIIEFNLSGSNSPQLAALPSGSLAVIPHQLAAGSFIIPKDIAEKGYLKKTKTIPTP